MVGRVSARKIGDIFSSMAATMGLVVLAAWLLSLSTVTSGAAMTPLTAASLAGLGIAARLGVHRHGERRRAVALALAAAVGVACMLVVLRWATADAVRAGDLFGAVDLSAEVRLPAPALAFGHAVMAACIALPLLSVKGVRLARAIAAAWLPVAATAAVAGWFDVPALGRPDLFHDVPPLAAIGQMLIAAGIVLTVRQRSQAAPTRRFVTFATSALLAVAALMVWALTLIGDHADLTRQVTQQTTNVARLVQEHARRSIDAADVALRQVEDMVLRDGLDGVGQDGEAWARLQAMQVRLPQVTSLNFIDRAGRIRLSSLRHPPPEGDFSFRDYFRIHRDGGAEVHLGASIEGAVNGQRIFTYSRRLNDADGRFAGILLAGLDVDYFVSFYKTLELGADGTIALLNRDGYLLARHPMRPELLGRNLSDDQLFKTRLPESLVGTYLSSSPIDRIERYVAYRATDDFPLVALSSISHRHMIAAFNDRLVAATVLLLITWAVIAGALLVQLRRIEHEEAAFRAIENSRDFIQSVVNSVGHHIAIIDESGRIVMTNRAWRRFANANGAPVGTDHVGLNYFDACRAAPGATEDAGDTDADRAAAGIAAVLQGVREGFEMQYPCDAPDAQRWFLMRVTKLKGQERGVVVSHEDITAMKAAEEALRVAATRDALTGLLNRRAFVESGDRELAMARRHGYPVSAIMLDCDHFKAVNDTYGHAVGDLVLKALAAAMQDRIRTTDVAARLGGEEFVILLPHTAAAEARILAERLREDVAARLVPSDQGPVSVTVSLGLAEAAPEATLDSLLERADQALYRAKTNGRNRTEVMARVVAMAG